MKNHYALSGISAGPRKPRRLPSAAIRSPYGFLRGARKLLAPLALLAMVTYLLQPVLCWPSQLHDTTAANASVRGISDAPAAGAACAESVTTAAGLQGSDHHDADPCCVTRDAVSLVATPVQFAPLAVPSVPFVDTVPSASAVFGTDLWRTVASPPLLDSWRRARPVPYHARTARRLT